MALRIVSLVPSQTELLFDLGLDTEVVGLTKFCIHPAEKVADKTRVGGTKAVHIGRVAALKPTLILANHEENTQADVLALEKIAPVYTTNIRTFSDALDMIREVGKVVGREAEAREMAQQIQVAMTNLAPLPVRPRVTYLIWRNPYMVAASDTFIDAMLTLAGFSNAFANQTRYPVIAAEAIRDARPDLIFMSSEPYPFRPKHLLELQEACPDARIDLVDGELFSWYGSRLLRSAAYFDQLHRTLINR